MTADGTNIKTLKIMKKLFYMISTVALMASFAACNKMEQGNDPVTDGPQVETPSADGTVTLNVLAAAPQTKVYMSGGHTLWVTGDVITVFAPDGYSVVSDAVAAAADAYNFTVTGWEAGKTPSIALAAGPLTYYSYYDEVAYTGGVIRAKLRPQQSLYHSNSFSKLANIAVGELDYDEETGAYSTTMRNLCGLIGVRVEGSNVKKIVISDVDGKPMTGEIDMHMTLEGEINVPIAEVVAEKGVSSVTLTASKATWNNKTEFFAAGAKVYACVLPGTYNLKIEAYGEDDALLNTLTATAPITIVRNQYRTIDVPVDTYKPADYLTITLDVSSNPFTTSLPDFKNEEKTGPDTYTSVEGNYEYVIESSTKYGLSGNYLRLTSTSGYCGYIKLPALPDYKLISVEVTGGNGTANKKSFSLFDVDPIAAEWGTPLASTPRIGVEETAKLEVPEPIVNTGYYIASQTNNAQFAKLVLTYMKVNE